MSCQEPLQEMFTRSVRMILDFAQIPGGLPQEQNIELYFSRLTRQGKDPKLPANRQQFNNSMLAKTGARYLVSSYGEDRSAMLTGSSIAKEGRVLHMGIDIFSRQLETVYAPCNGRIVRVGQEPEAHSFGYYVIIKPDDHDFYVFLGHLNSTLPPIGPVVAGQAIAKLGDYTHNENGGWSRHLHLQLCRDLPPEGQAPLGYSSKAMLPENQLAYPDPVLLFPDWKLV